MLKLVSNKSFTICLFWCSGLFHLHKNNLTYFSSYEYPKPIVAIAIVAAEIFGWWSCFYCFQRHIRCYFFLFCCVELFHPSGQYCNAVFSYNYPKHIADFLPFLIKAEFAAVTSLVFNDSSDARLFLCVGLFRLCGNTLKLYFAS